ncbi:MAG: hypothetical protein KJ011_11490 [Burkholderiaceae bacterium]|nr:hypothetical protein [Burkholderiaceae bacterium]
MRRVPAHHPLQLVLGLSVWAVWFVVVYGGTSVACALAPPLAGPGAWNLVNGILLLFTLATLALLLRLAWRCRGASRNASSMPPNDARRFIAGLGAALYATAAVSTAFVALPLLVLPPCL